MAKNTPLSLFKKSFPNVEEEVDSDEDDKIDTSSTPSVMTSRRLFTHTNPDAQAGTSLFSSVLNPPITTNSYLRTSAPPGFNTTPMTSTLVQTTPVIKPIRVAATPPYYTGSKSSCPYEFMSAFLRAAESNGWSEQMIIKQFPIFLRDKALAWYESKTAIRLRAGEPTWTWQKLKDEFLNSNGPIEARRDQLEWKILTMRQSKDENCSEFLIKMENLCNRLNHNMSEARRIKLCIRGLHKEAIQAVNMQNPKTYSDLANLLAKYDETYIIAGNAETDEDAVIQVALPENREKVSKLNETEIKPNQKIVSETELDHLVKRIRKLELQGSGHTKYPSRPFQPYYNSNYHTVPRNIRPNINNSQHQLVTYDPRTQARNSNYYNNQSYRNRVNRFQYNSGNNSRPLSGQRTPNTYRDQATRNIICFKCQRPGHISRECTEALARTNVNLNSGRPQETGVPAV